MEHVFGMGDDLEEDKREQQMPSPAWGFDLYFSVLVCHIFTFQFSRFIKNVLFTRKHVMAIVQNHVLLVGWQTINVIMIFYPCSPHKFQEWNQCNLTNMRGCFIKAI